MLWVLLVPLMVLAIAIATVPITVVSFLDRRSERAAVEQRSTTPRRTPAAKADEALRDAA